MYFKLLYQLLLIIKIVKFKKKNKKKKKITWAPICLILGTHSEGPPKPNNEIFNQFNYY
jgi:hypothetical protein